MRHILEHTPRENPRRPRQPAAERPQKLRDLEAAARREPENPLLLERLGRALEEAGDDLRAERALLASLARREGAAARERLAEIYRRRGQLRRAELVHLEGLRRTPRDPGKLTVYADFLEATGRPEEAKRFRAAGRRWPLSAAAAS